MLITKEQAEIIKIILDSNTDEYDIEQEFFNSDFSVYFSNIQKSIDKAIDELESKTYIINDNIKGVDKEIENDEEASYILDTLEEIIDEFSTLDFINETVNLFTTLISEWEDTFKSYKDKIASDLNETYHNHIEALNEINIKFSEMTQQNFHFLSKRDLINVDSYISDFNDNLKNIEYQEQEKKDIEERIDLLELEHLEDEKEAIEEELENTIEKFNESKKNAIHYLQAFGYDIERVNEETIKFFDKLNIEIEKFEKIRNEIIDFLEEHFPDENLIKQESYYIETQKKGITDLQKFVLKKQFFENEIIIPNKGLKENTLVIFSDFSFNVFDQKGNFVNSAFRNNKHFIHDFLKKVIEHDLRKTPKWTPFFKNLYNKSVMNRKYNRTDVYTFFETIDKFKQHKHVFENSENLNFEILNDKKNDGISFERLYDLMELEIKKHSVKKMVNSFFSSKYKHLLNKESYQYFESLYDNKIETKTIREQLINKLASYKEQKSFNDALRKASYSLLNWHPDLIKNKFKDQNIEIIHENNDELIVKINDFNSSKSLGSQSWCISRSPNFWESYTSRGTQYFIYDFKKSPDDNNSMIGLTFNHNTNYYRSHARNDSSIPKTENQLWINHILFNTTKDKYILRKEYEKLSDDDSKIIKNCYNDKIKDIYIEEKIYTLKKKIHIFKKIK